MLWAEIRKAYPDQWLIVEALERYSAGDISFGAATEQAKVSQDDLARHAYARGMEPPFSPESLVEELF